MSIVQSATVSQDKINSLIRSQKVDKRNEAEVSTDAATKKDKASIHRDQSEKSSNKGVSGEAGPGKASEKLEINEYLKVVSRLENKLNSEELQDEELDKVSLSLEEKILSLPDVQKTRLRNLKFFKENGIDNIKDLKKTLFDMFKNVNEREALFEFLKSPEFMSILLNESDKPNTYSAPTASSVASSAKKPGLDSG